MEITMNCDEYQRNFSKLMDNELNEADCAELFTHMGSCVACREFFRTSMQIQSAMNELSVPEPIGLGRPFSKQTSTSSKALPLISLYRTMHETKISLSFATAVVIVTMAGAIALSSFLMRSGRGANERAERVVYNYMLPTVYVEPEVILQQNASH
jgi:hypothetical protein